MFSGTALVTGASSGIGAEFAAQLHSRGMKVVLVARRKDLLEELAQVLNQLRADSAEVLQADLCCQSGEGGGISAVVDYLRENEIDLLVNNAGRGSFGYYETLDLRSELDQVKLNISATMILAHEAIAGMKKRGRGSLISISSVAAFQPLPLMATYAGTKSFNFMHTLALREELKGTGVRALAVCPGPVATEFGGVARVPGTFSGGTRDSTEKVVRQSLKALEKNRAFVIPGKGRYMSWLSRFLPKTLSTAKVGSVLKDVLIKDKECR